MVPALTFSLIYKLEPTWARLRRFQVLYYMIQGHVFIFKEEEALLF